MVKRSSLLACLATLALAGCNGSGAAYRPQAREVTLTAVPVLVHEHEKLFPFLKADFAPGGVLEGKELYAFIPSTITAVEGDTLHLTIVNPEDDAHNLVLPGLSLPLPGQQTTRATYVVGGPGIYPFVCNMAAHLPMMSGQLVVLTARAVERR